GQRLRAQGELLAEPVRAGRGGLAQRRRAPGVSRPPILRHLGAIAELPPLERRISQRCRRAVANAGGSGGGARPGEARCRVRQPAVEGGGSIPGSPVMPAGTPGGSGVRRIETTSNRSGISAVRVWPAMHARASRRPSAALRETKLFRT